MNTSLVIILIILLFALVAVAAVATSRSRARRLEENRAAPAESREPAEIRVRTDAHERLEAEEDTGKAQQRLEAEELRTHAVEIGPDHGPVVRP